MLRRELRPWGIHVAVIEPGTIATPIWDKGSRQADELHREDAARGSGSCTASGSRRWRRCSPGRTSAARRPSKVADAVEHALTAKRPRTRYLVGDARLLIALKWLLPTRLLDRLLYRATS